MPAAPTLSTLGVALLTVHTAGSGFACQPIIAASKNKIHDDGRGIVFVVCHATLLLYDVRIDPTEALSERRTIGVHHVVPYTRCSN